MMPRRIVCLVTLSLIIALPGLAVAQGRTFPSKATLFTPLRNVATGERFTCTVLNVGATPVTVILKVWGPEGSMGASQGILSPGTGDAISPPPESGGTFGCKITVVNGGKQMVLGGGTISPGGSFVTAE